MFYFIADPRSGEERGGCNACCCEQMSARPGEINMVEIDYTQWAAPLRGRGLDNKTAITVSACKNCGDAPDAGGAPAIDPARITVDRRNFQLRFAVAIPDNAQIGNIYTINIAQTALDCDFQPFIHRACIDLTIGKCG